LLAGTTYCFRTRKCVTGEAAVNRLTIYVKATWDEEAEVWVAESDDIEGLITEAATLEALRDRVLIMIGELLELNGGGRSDFPEIPVHILAEQVTRVVNPHF
jgi:predicted RNase H-like HicB family nuclease